MTEYQKLVDAEKTYCTIEIEEISTGKGGVANSEDDGKVAVFYGAEDGSDDKVISAEGFNQSFRITAMINN